MSLSETAVQQQSRLILARMGGLPMRNNVGACTDDNGRVIRYGLMNESKAQNEQFKSSDLISPIPIVIQPHHVGKVLGVMACLEMKEEGWHLTPGDKRGQAQLRFIELMRSVGCIAGFVTHPDQVEQYVAAFR